MKIFNKRIVLITIFLTLSSGISANANLDKQKEALDIIADFADRMCNQVSSSGSMGGLELSGTAKAELSKLLKKVANLGIEGAAKYKQSKYNNVL